MKNLLLTKKTKIIVSGLVLTIISGAIFSFVFFLNKDNTSDKILEDDFDDAFINIDMNDELKNQNLGILVNKKTKRFSDNQIKNNFGDLVKKTIIYTDGFINEDINDYLIKILYNLNESKNNLKANIFLYNKKVKNKKFKSFFQVFLT